jgi:hypothetical protein
MKFKNRAFEFKIKEKIGNVVKKWRSLKRIRKNKEIKGDNAKKG